MADYKKDALRGGFMKTILVTGANRGIGLEICRQLDALGHSVILGARDYEKGKEAAESLSNKVVVQQLDVTSEDDIQQLFRFVKNEVGKLDVLINNAGVGTNHDGSEDAVSSGVRNLMGNKMQSVRQVARKFTPILRKFGVKSRKKGAKDIDLENVKKVMETNFYGAWRMIQIFLPLLLKSDDSRIINISSGLGELNKLTGSYPGYSLSKAALNALTIMFSNELAGKNITINAMCPGWVKTDMGGPDAPREVAEGADTAVWLATEKAIPSGKFFRDRKEISW
jgi:NAD(P)-dependent dehydrogenase (short-subunit alcohol dehydrogenase family)